MMSSGGFFGTGIDDYQRGCLFSSASTSFWHVAESYQRFTGQFSIGHAGFMAVGLASAYFTVSWNQCACRWLNAEIEFLRWKSLSITTASAVPNLLLLIAVMIGAVSPADGLDCRYSQFAFER